MKVQDVRLELTEKHHIRYTVIQTTIAMEKLGEVKTFGLCVLDQYGNRIKEIVDISVNFELVERLASICNRFQALPIHLMDIVEDFIAEI